MDNRGSPSPPNSASTLSSSINGGGSGFGMEDLSFGGEGSLLPWFIGEIDDPSLNFKQLLQTPTTFGTDGLGATIQNVGMNNNFNFMESLSSNLGSTTGCGSNCIPMCALQQGHVGIISPDEQFNVIDEKPEVLNAQFQTIQNPSCYVPSLDYGQLELPFQDHEIMPRKQEQFQMHPELLMGLSPQLDLKQQNSQVPALRNELVKILEMFQTGNFTLAQVILARLNHQMSFPGKPLVRATAFYVKEELEKLLTMNNPFGAPPPPKNLTASDVVYKMSAYKLFSEVSPIMQFVDFTCTQALLEALDESDCIHILDFDIGCGSMWASFIRELSLRKKGTPFLKISAFVSTSTHHPFELALICDNILEFATECEVSVDFKVVSLDLFDPNSCSIPNFHLNENEGVAVNFSIWACSHSPFLLSPLLSLIKQCAPKIMISFDKGCDRCDLSFPSHILRVLDSCTNLLESLDGSSVAPHIIDKIEKLLIQPMVERHVWGRIHAPNKMQANKMHHWKSIFASAGFFPSPFSTFTESQADQLVNRVPVKGFHVENRQASLVFGWQCHELVAASAWKC